MIKHRIVPYGETSWTVERTSYPGADIWIRVKDYTRKFGVNDIQFKTEKEAEDWIEKELELISRAIITQNTIEERKRKNPPREYP